MTWSLGICGVSRHCASAAERSSTVDHTTLWHDIRSLTRPAVADRIEFFVATVREIYERLRPSVGLSLPGLRCATSRGFAGLQSPPPPPPTLCPCRRPASSAIRRSSFRPAGSGSPNIVSYWLCTLNYRPPEPFSRRHDFWRNVTTQTAGSFFVARYSEVKAQAMIKQIFLKFIVRIWNRMSQYDTSASL